MTAPMTATEEYDTAVKVLSGMESRYKSGFSSTDRAFIDTLYLRLFGKPLRRGACSNCYRDAYIEITVKLRKDKRMPEQSRYKLKAGAVIRFFGEARVYTNANLTDEAAERYLSGNPLNSAKFATLPADWQTRAAAYVRRKAAADTEAAKEEAKADTATKEATAATKEAVKTATDTAAKDTAKEATKTATEAKTAATKTTTAKAATKEAAKEATATAAKA